MDNVDVLGKEIDTKKNAEIISSKVDENKLEASTSQYDLSLTRLDFNDLKDRKRFIKSVESIIRKSPEYKLWVLYLREVLGEYVCKLTGEIHAQTSVDIHHHPISLYVICNAVVDKYQMQDREFTSLEISTEVLNLHYQNRVGYIPLVSSLHEKFHNGFLEIPMELIHGDYQHILNTYIIDEDDQAVIDERLKVKMDHVDYKFWLKEQNESEDE